MLVDPALVARAIGRLHPKDPPSEPGKLVVMEYLGQVERAGRTAREGTTGSNIVRMGNP
jgi:hypothetical protein